MRYFNCRNVAVATVAVSLASITLTHGFVHKPNPLRIPIDIHCPTKPNTRKDASPNNMEHDSRNQNDSSYLHTRQHFNRILQSAFLLPIITTTTTTIPFLPTSITQANAFEGGVGGLGKTKPNTGVTYANPDVIPDVSTLPIPGDYNAELVAPDGTPVLLSFYAAWPMLKSQGIESRDLANAESSFVQVAKLENGVGYLGKDGSLKKKFFLDTIFAQTGKFGAYGDPTDVKVSKVEDSDSNKGLYVVSFTTLTPAMRESDRKVYVSTRIVGDGVFMLVTGTTLGRFRSQEKLLRKVSDSFECVEAPRSSLRR